MNGSGGHEDEISDKVTQHPAAGGLLALQDLEQSLVGGAECDHVTRRRVGGAGQRCTNPRIGSLSWEIPCPDGPLFKNFNADLVIYIATTGVCVYS